MNIVSPGVRRMIDAAQSDPERYWDEAARQLPWFRTWDKVFEHDPPTFRWFLGGRTNISYNALDYHLSRGWGGHAALISENELGERRTFTYAQLHHEVKRIAKTLRGLGVKRGDRVAIYMPTMPEAIAAMLATTRIGAIHLVVFAGFGSGALSERVRLAEAKILLTADGTWRKGNLVPLSGIVEEALATPDCPIEKVVVLGRKGEPKSLKPGRDLTWEQFLALGDG